MSKWIIGFPPNKSGSYLVTQTPITYPISSCGRWEYDYITDFWKQKDITTKFKDSYAWWDEYKLTEEKKKLKLNFKTNGKI